MIAPNFNDLRGNSERIHIHGHRGARGSLPENTIKGFVSTFGMGVRIIELDILATSDGIPVITHNPQLMPFTTRYGDGCWLTEPGPRISSISYEELLKFDIGGLKPNSEYASLFPDQAFLHGLKIPKFEELCTLITQSEYKDCWLNIEIKSDPRYPQNTPPIPDFVGLILRDIIKADIAKRVILQSFDWRVLHECANQCPDIPRSYLTYAQKPNAPMAVNVYENSDWMAGLSLEQYSGSLPELIAADGGKVWSPYFSDINDKDITRAKELGLVVNVWTVNEIADIDRMIELEVDGIITDYPGRVQQRLVEQGLSWAVSNANNNGSTDTLIG